MCCSIIYIRDYLFSYLHFLFQLCTTLFFTLFMYLYIYYIIFNVAKVEFILSLSNLQRRKISFCTSKTASFIYKRILDSGDCIACVYFTEKNIILKCSSYFSILFKSQLLLSNKVNILIIQTLNLNIEKTYLIGTLNHCISYIVMNKICETLYCPKSIKYI